MLETSVTETTSSFVSSFSQTVEDRLVIISTNTLECPGDIDRFIKVGITTLI